MAASRCRRTTTAYPLLLATLMPAALLLAGGCARGLPHVSEWPQDLVTPSRAGALLHDAGGGDAAAPAHDAAAGAPAAAADAQATSWLTEQQWQELRSGRLVTKPMTFSIRSGSYIGGVALQRVRVPPDNLADFITDVPNIQHWMPYTRRVQQVDGSGCDVVIELEQGVRAYSKVYSIRAFRVGRMVQWRLDPSRPHDIDDIWGYFRAVPFEGGSLLIMGIAVDMRAGLLGPAVEDQVMGRLLELPDDIRSVADGLSWELKQRAAAGSMPCIDR